MKILYFTLLFVFVAAACYPQSTTPIPNNSFELWTNYGNYSNPDFWDSPNEEISAIPFFGTTVVTKSTDHQASGSYSVKLESKHISLPPVDVPGFITLGNFTLDIVNMTYTITGGVPVNDEPTHLKGFFRYFPKGGDSCLMAVGLFKSDNGVRDTVAGGYFSTKDTVPDWTPFSAWIDYYDTIDPPDSMNVFAFSTAQEVVTAGTVLYLDNLYMDYTVGFNEKDPGAGISVYNDKETKRLMVFFDFPQQQQVSVDLYNMTGQVVGSSPVSGIMNDRRILSYDKLREGVYVLEILHSGKKYSKKFFLN